MISQSMLQLPLIDVLRPEIALVLRMYGLNTVGGFIMAWRDPVARKHVESVFDSGAQAWHAAATFAAWLGLADSPPAIEMRAWWRE